MKLKEKLAYGLGDMASAFVFMSVTSFALYFYTDAVLFSAATAGTIILYSKILDAFTDILFGHLVDKTKSKYGKARPWLLKMALPFAISAVLAFWMPFENHTYKVIYAFISYNLVMTIYTAINIPYGVLAAKMTDEPVLRGILGIFRMVFAMLGMMIVMALVPILFVRLGGGDASLEAQPPEVLIKGFPLTFILLGAIAAFLFLLTFLGTKERVNVEEERKIDFITSFKALIRNKNWWILLIHNIVSFIGATGKLSCAIYFAIYFLKNRDMIAPLTILGLMPGIITMILLAPWLYKKYGKRNASLLSFAGLALTHLVMVLTVRDASDSTWLFFLLVLSALALGPSMAAGFAMMADCIEYVEWKTSTRSEGLTYSAASLGVKLGAGIGTVIVGFLLKQGGYVANQEVQSPEALKAIFISFLVLPLISYCVSFILFLFYDVDKKWPIIMKDLKDRRG